MNRRGFFKGATGAAIAGPEALRQVAKGQSGYTPPMDIYNINPAKDAPLAKILDDPLRLAKEAFRNHCRAQERLLTMQINNKIAAIHRQKSTSDAYKHYMTVKLEQERSTVWANAEDLIQSSW